MCSSTRRSRKFTGDTVDETLKLRYQNITPIEHEEADRAQITQLKVQGQVAPFEKNYIHKDGSIVPIRLMLGVLNLEGDDFIWSVVESVSNKTGAALRPTWLSPGLYQELFRQVPLAMALCDQEGRYIDVNQAYADLIGRTVDETLGLTFWDITPREYHKENREEMSKIGETGSFGPWTKEYFRKEGGDRVSRVTVTLLGASVKLHNESYMWVVCLPHLPTAAGRTERDTRSWAAMSSGSPREARDSEWCRWCPSETNLEAIRSQQLLRRAKLALGSTRRLDRSPAIRPSSRSRLIRRASDRSRI